MQKNLNYEKYVQFLIVPMEETWLYERLFFEMVIVMIKDLKIQYKRQSVNKT